MAVEKWDEGSDPTGHLSEHRSRPESQTAKYPIKTEELQNAWCATYEPQAKNVAKKDKKLAKSVEEAELRRLRQSNELRPWFMGVVLAIAGVLVLSSCFVAIWLTISKQMTDAIGVGFIVSLGVETIGVVAIIAHYLFAVPDSNLLDEEHRQEE